MRYINPRLIDWLMWQVRQGWNTALTVALEKKHKKNKRQLIISVRNKLCKVEEIIEVDKFNCVWIIKPTLLIILVTYSMVKPGVLEALHFL